MVGFWGMLARRGARKFFSSGGMSPRQKRKRKRQMRRRRMRRRIKQ
jgi:hypothetical protein